MTEPIRLLTVSAVSWSATGPSRDVETVKEALALAAEWIEEYPGVRIGPNIPALLAKEVRRPGLTA